MNVVLIVLDTLRADHLGCYGYFRDTSPAIDRIAEEGVLFEDFRASGVATGPGFTSLMTGLFPIQNGFYLTPHSLPNMISFNDDIPTLAEMIWENSNHTTAAFDNLINFRSHMTQFVRGFEYCVNVTRTAMWKHAHVRGDAVNARLAPWLEQHRDEDFFAFVHYWDPHTPYNQPDDYRNLFRHQPGSLDDLTVRRAPAGYDYVPGWGKVGELWEQDVEDKGGAALTTAERTIDLYDGEIRYTDTLIEEVFSALKANGLYDNTLVIITADHGEQLGQHGMYGHAGLHEANIKLPLIMWAPHRLPAGKRIPGCAGHVDIVPTILDLLGASRLPSNLAGRSLMPVIGENATLPDTTFFESIGMRGMLHGCWKYVRYARDWPVASPEELYDLSSDPMEVDNLAGRGLSRQNDLRRQLEEWVTAHLGAHPDPMIENIEKDIAAQHANAFKPTGFLPWLAQDAEAGRHE